MFMGYDIPSKYNKGPRSELQWKILIHVCKTKDADFKSICKETGRDRTTIIQSIGPMIRRKLIDKIRVDPLLVKSRVIFLLTYSGKCYIEAFGLNVEDIFRTETDPNILRYLQIVDQLSNTSQRKVMFRELAFNVLDQSIIDDQGNIKTEDMISALKDAFLDALTSLIQDADYNTSNLFNNETIQWIAEFFSENEVKDLGKKLLKVKKNTVSTIRILSKL
jgi:hypothetical protein